MQLTPEQSQDLIDRILDVVQAERIILFGSSARGEAGPSSDIDVLVVAPEEAHRRKTAQAIYRRLLGFGLPVDIIVALPSDLEKYRDSSGFIYREVLRDGRVLYAA